MEEEVGVCAAYIEVSIFGGANIKHAAMDMCNVAKRLMICVFATFNDVRIHANPGDFVEDVIKRYEAEVVRRLVR